MILSEVIYFYPKETSQIAYYLEGLCKISYFVKLGYIQLYKTECQKLGQASFEYEGIWMTDVNLRNIIKAVVLIK